MALRTLGRRELLRLAAATAIPVAVRAAAKSYFVYWGTYTEGGGQFGEGESKGIYVSRMDAATGKLTEPELAVESPNPSWLTMHPNGRYLYAANERIEPGGKIPPGEVSSYSMDRKTGKLASINRVSSKGGQPCHVAIDHTGRMAMVANWYTGSTAAFPIGKHGELGESSAFSQHVGPRSGVPAPGEPQIHCHSVVVSSDNRFLLSSDTGLNRVYVFNLDPAKASFTPHDPPFLGLEKPTNPRHIAIHPSNKWVYAANEIAPGGCTQLQFNAANGTLSEGPVTASVPADFKGRGSQAEVVVHPSGKFVYVSNRGHNSIAAFRVDQTDGTLTLVEAFLPGGETPRSFAIDPAGQFLIAMMQRTGTMMTLKIDQETGKLTRAGDALKLSRPVCALFVA